MVLAAELLQSMCPCVVATVVILNTPAQIVIGSRAAGFKRPLLSVDVSVWRRLWC